MKKFFMDYWKNGSKLDKKYLKKHWKGVVLLNAMIVVCYAILNYKNEIINMINTKFNRKDKIES